MLNRFVLIAVIVPLAIILVALAVANRSPTAFTLDPFNPGNPALTIQLPLFVLLFIAHRPRHDRRQPGDLVQAGPLSQDGAPAQPGSRNAARRPRAPALRALNLRNRRHCRAPSRQALAELIMLTISADDIDRALTFPGLVETLRHAFRGGRGPAGAPSPHDRPARRRGVDAAPDAGLDRFQRRRNVEGRLYRRQGRHRIAGQQRRRQAGGDGALSAA